MDPTQKVVIFHLNMDFSSLKQVFSFLYICSGGADGSQFKAAEKSKGDQSNVFLVDNVSNMSSYIGSACVRLALIYGSTYVANKTCHTFGQNPLN